MKYAKGGARHPFITMLALTALMISVVLPGLRNSLAAPSATAANAKHLSARPVAKATAPVVLPASRTATAKSNQYQDKPLNHVPPPDGRIAFASDRDGDFEIYLIDPDGGGLARLTDNETDDISPAWSPDGERLAFVSYRDGNAEIYAMDVTGGSQTRLTDDPASDLDPAWSPDGARIAFTSGRGNTDEVYVMNADGGGLMNHSHNMEGDDVQPAWSPDGTMIAFASNRDDNFEIYVSNADDGGNQRNLSNNAATDSNPAWSPMRITFQSDRDSPPNIPETNFEIYSMSGANGSNQTRLTTNADDSSTPPVDESFDVAPARSSDGARLAFASTRDGDFEIYLANADGSGAIKLTDNDEANDIEPAVEPLATLTAEGSIQFSAASYSVDEGAGSATITVTRTGSTSGGAIIDVGVSGGTASERSDFIPAFRTLTFAVGETSQTFTVLIIDDGFAEFDETLNLSLGSPTGTTLGSPGTATLTITDNDSVTSGANPIDDSRFFVRQQYLDFLAREADPSGLDFWTNQLTTAINLCPSAPADVRARCVLDARSQVSTAFFLSIEFQETGYFVIRLYREAFGRLPTLREFLIDMQNIGRGVVIGQPGARELLEANQRRFAGDFTNRVAFKTRYDGMSNADFVNTLFANTGLEPGAEMAARAALLAGLNNGSESRATVLVKVGDTESVFNALYNEAFVLMEYFGYLRRDPDEAGFNFWLDKLNNASVGGEDVRDPVVALRRIRRAEIVESFVDSIEYRSRFGRT